MEPSKKSSTLVFVQTEKYSQLQSSTLTGRKMKLIEVKDTPNETTEAIAQYLTDRLAKQQQQQFV